METLQPTTTLTDYIAHCVHVAGSHYALGQRLGFTSGGRVGAWRAGKGRPSELACLQLAAFSGHAGLDILRLAGYTAMADLIEAGATGPPRVPDQHKMRLEASLRPVEDMIDMLKSYVERI